MEKSAIRNCWIAEGVQFYCPSSTYPAIVLLVLYFIAWLWSNKLHFFSDFSALWEPRAAWCCKVVCIPIYYVTLMPSSSLSVGWCWESSRLLLLQLSWPEKMATALGHMPNTGQPCLPTSPCTAGTTAQSPPTIYSKPIGQWSHPPFPPVFLSPKFCSILHL